MRERWSRRVASAPERQENSLRQAFVPAPDPGGASETIPMRYLVLEETERLWRDAGRSGYRNLLGRLSVSVTYGWPESWAFAFAALYAGEPAVQRRAAGQAWVLDRHSQRLAAAGPEILAAARTWASRPDPWDAPR